MEPVDTIGKYQVRTVLGRGGMGTVYEAMDPHIHRKVALKVMGEGLAQSASLRERFLREAQAAGALRHKNIVTIYDFGEDEHHPYIAMEFIEGTDLETIIQNREPLSIEWKLDVLRQICEGLGHAHRQGVVHRDVKPANIRVTPQGEVKIVDFGIARVQSAARATRAGRVLGTIHYTAPEQIDRDTADHRADIFSVGAIAYELLAYRKPFDGDSLTEVMFRIMNERPDPSALPRSLYSPGLEAIVMKALARDVQERYQTLEEMHGELEDLVRRTAARVLEESDPAAGLLAEARQERTAGRLGEALRRTREAAALDPARTETSALLAELEGQERQGRSSRWIEEARRHLEEGDARKALECANQALALSPGDAVARALVREAEAAGLGKAPQGEAVERRAAIRRARQEGKLQKALGLCRKALEQEPADEELLREAAEIEGEIHSREVEQLGAAALAYMAEGDLDLADKILAKIGRLAPESARYIELQAYFDQERRRRVADALATTATEHLALGNLDEARAAAEEALTALPSHVQARQVRDAVERLLRAREPMAEEEAPSPQSSLESPSTAPAAPPAPSAAEGGEEPKAAEGQSATTEEAVSRLEAGEPPEPIPDLAAGEEEGIAVEEEGVAAEDDAGAPLEALVAAPEADAGADEGEASAEPSPGDDAKAQPAATTASEEAASLVEAIAAAASAEALPLTPLPEGLPRDPEAARLLEVGRRALRDRDPARGLAALEEARRLQPEHAAIRRLLAAAREEAARARLEELAADALEHFIHSRYGPAREAVGELLRLDPHDRRAAELREILKALP